MVELDRVMQIMEETKNGCDHICKKCDIYLPARNECFHTALKRWQEWNKKEHDRFGRILKGEE